MILAWAGGCQRIQITGSTEYTIFIFGIRALRVSTSVACGGAEGKGKEGMASKGRKAVRLREGDCGLWVLGGLWSTERGTQVPTSHLLSILRTALQQSRASHMLLSALLCCTCTSFPNRAVIRKTQPDNSHSPRLDLGPDQPPPTPHPCPLLPHVLQRSNHQKTTAHGRAGAQTGRRCSTPCSACSVMCGWVAAMV